MGSTPTTESGADRRGTMRRLLAPAISAAAILGLVTVAPAVANAAPSPRVPATTYQLSLGDSLGAGYGATSPAADYASLVTAHEATNFPGLTLENLSCSGATTNSMIKGPGCSYPAGNQLAQAEAFLRANAGHVAYITIDIGANNVDGCLTGSTIDVNCILTGLTALETDLPQIVAGLQAAGPGVPIFGMNYYDPFLAQWFTPGGPQGRTNATESARLAQILDGTIDSIYGSYGAFPVDVEGAFATQDFGDTGTYSGTSLPLNVATICNWTYMCGSQAGTYGIHTNDTGYGVLAATFEHVIDRWFRGGGHGQWLTSSDGTVYPVGNAANLTTSVPRLNAPIVGMAPTSDGGGYWLAAADGGVFALGTAHFYGSMGGTHLNAPVVGIAATPDGKGYWLVAADGGVFSFGDATFHGSTGALHLNAPVVGMAADSSGHGYWLVAADGGVFAFGDASFLGSTGAQHLNAPVVGMAPTIDSGGYWLVAADGGVFSFGDATFHGSTGALRLHAPVVGMAVSPTGYGYWLGAADGGVFTFGRATYNGSAAGDMPATVVAIATN